MDLFSKSKFLSLLKGFRKNHSTRNALLNMTGKWKQALDEDKKIGTIFMDLPKSFNTLNHNVLLCKLIAHGFLSMQ